MIQSTEFDQSVIGSDHLNFILKKSMPSMDPMEAFVQVKCDNGNQQQDKTDLLPKPKEQKAKQTPLNLHTIRQWTNVLLILLFVPF